MGLFGKSKLNREPIKSYHPPQGAVPVCPYCESRLDGVYTQEVSNEFGKTWLYFCMRCSKVLGTSQRKGFWMG